MNNPVFDIAHSLQLCEGAVLGFSDDGTVLVQLNDSGTMVSCNTLCTNKDNPLKVDIDDKVLVTQGSSENGTCYILGIIGIPTSTKKAATVETKDVKEFIVPQKPLTATVDGKRVKISADEEIVLTCGEGSIHIMKDGKITLRGTDLISRASRTNKIRGAAVRIN
jgi:hypothetical protein